MPGALSCGVPFTVTAIVFGVAAAVAASVAVSTMLSVALEALVSVTLAKVALISARVPPMVRLFDPAPVNVAKPDAVAPKWPLVSASVRLKVAPTAEPASANVMLPMAPALPMPITAVDGAVMTGALATATAIVPVPLLPKLSVATIPIVSDGETLSVLDSVARAAFTCTSEPLIVTLVVPLVLTDAPSGLPTVSRPLVSDSTTVNVSPLVLPVSPTLMPPIAVALPADVEALAGAVTTGGPFTVTATLNGVPAALCVVSVALITIVSDPAVGLLSFSDASVALTSASAPTIVTLVLPEPVTVSAPEAVSDSSPCVSATVTL